MDSMSISMMVSAAPSTAWSMAQAGKPYILYGTAWKKERTAQLVSEAVHAGFRYIDTACQPRHYNEAGVGNGWTAAAEELGLQRSDFFLQTKYTPSGGQDHNNMPYALDDPIPVQVQKSLETSLANLHTDYLDSWVLHSPFNSMEDTLLAWKTMEEAVDAKKVRQLGISNCYDLHKFQTLYEAARHKPAVLQNRFYSDSNFDTSLREYIQQQPTRITYQSFWTLTANRNALALPEVQAEAKRKGLPSAQTYMFAFLMSLPGNYFTPLSGTTNPMHMAEDVAVMERMQHDPSAFFDSEEELKKFAETLGMPAL